MTTNMRVSVEQAAQTALQVYLQAELDPQFSGGENERCIVSDSWPEPDSGLSARAVSIIPAGPREDTHVTEEDLSYETISGELKLYTFRVACCRQPLQLDIWSRSGAQRDDLLARVTDALRKGERYTLGVANGSPVRDGVILELNPKSGFTGFADFTFDGPKKLDGSDSARKREYRASFMGFCDVNLTIKARAPRMARVLIKAALDGLPGAAPDITFTMNTTTGDVAVTGT